MAAQLQKFTFAPNQIVTRSEFERHAVHAARVANEHADRRALVDVMAVMDSVHASDDEIWMISYMDIMTLLLTLFVLLLAYSKFAPVSAVGAVSAPVADVAVRHTAPLAQPAAHAIDKGFVLPIALPHFTVIALPKRILQEGPAAAAIQTRVAQREGPILKLPVGLALRSEQKSVEHTEATLPQNPVPTTTADAREKFLEKMRTSALGKRIELTADQDNVNLEISDNILFDPGSATLKPHGQQLLNELAALLTAQDYSVSIEGHSDDVPFKNARFASNWELSATRATNVTRYLIAHGITAVRLRAIGYADTHPRADNVSVEGRARNRRVSLVLHIPVATAPRATKQSALP